MVKSNCTNLPYIQIYQYLDPYDTQKVDYIFFFFWYKKVDCILLTNKYDS